MVDPEEKEILKHLAQLGGLHDFVYTSSGELADRIGVSQQTASRKILELLERGLITRRMGTRKQLIRLSAQGAEVLRKEYAAYKAIFQGGEKVTLHGRVVAGLGEGQYYISREGYRRAFQALLGFEPYPGTLNVEIQPLDREKTAELKGMGGLLIKEFQSEGRTFGAVKCFRAQLQRVECAAIMPLRSHHTNTLEIISPVRLRDKLNLTDGTEVVVEVDLGTAPAPALSD